MIDIRKLKELVRLMVDNDLTELDLRDSEEQVTMRRTHGRLWRRDRRDVQHSEEAPLVTPLDRRRPGVGSGGLRVAL